MRGLYKTKGIVLRTVKLGEADKIVTIYSDNRGKIAAVAKGIRKTKSKFGSRLEPFSYVNLLLYQGKNLSTVTQVEVISPFKEIKSDFDKISYGSAMLDLVDKTSLEGSGDARVFHFLLASLEDLSKADGNYQLILAAFDFRLMAYLGYLPEVSACVVCKTEPSVTKKVVFSCQWGGVLCPKCAASDVGALFLSPATLTVLGHLLAVEIEEVAKIEVNKEILDELTNLAKDYIDYHLSAQLKSRKHLAKVS